MRMGRLTSTFVISEETKNGIKIVKKTSCCSVNFGCTIYPQPQLGSNKTK